MMILSKPLSPVSIDDVKSDGTADGLIQRVTGDSSTGSEVVLNIDKQEENQKRKHSSNQRDTTLERIFLIINFVVELPSAVFEQLSSVRKPQYALVSMIMSFTVMLISIIDLARTCQREGAKLTMRGSPSQSHKPLSTFAVIVGLVCSIFQCVFAAIAYAFLSRKAECPIKISVWPLIFASGVLWFRFPRNEHILERAEIRPNSPAPAQPALNRQQPPESPLPNRDKKMSTIEKLRVATLVRKAALQYRQLDT
ncbi:uncharacterized protein LOC110632545 [Hevea brasiliensis]|uniref:uncharacterized protein LOC110632545 n=1 Tax=Hevea brasiliensis TaxID=3981 RepID=UPI0025FE507C|nr:uncharacterized protein LOC110632545 [Hevea brasiliensis]